MDDREWEKEEVGFGRARRHKLRKSEVFQSFAWGISGAGIIAILTLVYSIVRNFSRDLVEETRRFEETVSRKLDRFEDKFNKWCR